MTQKKRKTKPGPKADTLKIELAPQEALRRLMAAPPEKKHRAGQRKRKSARRA